MKIVAIAATILTMCLVSACEKRDAIIIAGSTSVQPYAEVLAEEYEPVYPENEVDVQGGGSSAGIAAVISGTAHIGMSSRELTEKEQWLWSVEIAKDGLAIIIHPDNPINDLSLDQIRGIYSAKISDWSELGGAKSKIHIIAREEGSGTRSAFEGLVMGDDFITPKAIIQGANGAVRQLVSGDINSIGFISLGLVDHTVKAVHLEGIEPSPGNIFNGSYSLQRPFLFVTNGVPTGSTKQFVDFTLSSKGQRVLAKEGLVVMAEGAEK